MEIDYWNEDFCDEDIEDINDPDELESMEADLMCEIDNSKERVETYTDNLNVIKKRIGELK